MTRLRAMDRGWPTILSTAADAIEALTAPAMEAEPVDGMPARIWAGSRGVHGAVVTGVWADTIRHQKTSVEYIRADLAHPHDAESLQGEADSAAAGAYWELWQTAMAERDAALARVAEVDLIAEMLDAGQGDDDGAQILPNFEDGMTLAGKVEACLHLLERRRDVIDAYQSADADPPCTDCGGTGITYQTERRCACQGPAALTPPPDADLDALVARAILKARFYDCEPEMYDHDEAAFYDQVWSDHGDYALSEARAAITALRARHVVEADN